MTSQPFDFPKCFSSKKRTHHIIIEPVSDKKYAGWLKKQPACVRTQAEESGFNPKGLQTLFIRNSIGQLEKIYHGIHEEPGLYDFAACADAISKNLSKETLEKCSFEIETDSLEGEAQTRAFTGWGLGCYKFSRYKNSEKPAPCLILPKNADKKRINTFLENICLLRNLVNTPANDMGPEDLAAIAKKVASNDKAEISITKDKDLLKANFPMVYAVGDSSARRPCLIDITWGNPAHPKVTLVGKGVCFDTGGLDLKPSKAMELMKKDMGGAAHALTAGRIIMQLGLPVRLRIIIPAVENAVSGTSFRPGDILRTRKGLMVENTNTDAEGRLILSDALTLASEDNPDLIIDFATLTGSARAGLGPDIPALFSNNEKLAAQTKKIAFEIQDPVWPMPLWEPYNCYIESQTADIINSAGAPGDLIYSALFLKKFLNGNPDWIHFDIFSWEQKGRPGRPRGGADTGLRTVVALIEERYGNKK